MNSSIKTTTPAVIAITGTIGSGKSTFAKALKDLGCLIISADTLARKVVEPGSMGIKGIQELFGSDVISNDGILDRKKLGSIIFNDPVKKASLESVLHPLIRDAFNKEAQDMWDTIISKSPVPFIFYDIPLYFETNYQHPWIKKVITVAASPDVCIERIIQRDGLTREEAIARLSKQIPISEKIKNSDFVIDNNGDAIDLLEIAARRFIANLNEHCNKKN
jgi:dephospho-CoA kinase